MHTLSLSVFPHGGVPLPGPADGALRNFFQRLVFSRDLPTRLWRRHSVLAAAARQTFITPLSAQVTRFFTFLLVTQIARVSPAELFICSCAT